VKVFLTGATGYIGSGVAKAFRRAGHQVWGLIQSSTQVPLLAQYEIRPVIGDLRKPNSYLEVAEDCNVLVHCAADYQHDWAMSDRQTIETMLAASERGPQPKTIVFTSGSWVYGNTGGKPVDETTAPAPQIIAGAHRPAIEQMLIKAANVRGLVIRPANAYGKRGGMTGPWFADGYHGKAPMIVGDGYNHWPMVHVDDLAMGYLLAVESGLGGEIFNFADPSRATFRELVTAAVQAAGYKGAIESVPVPQAVERMSADAAVYAMDYLVDVGKATRRLGWKPKHESFIGEVETYFEAWKAWQSQ